jgi:hypothetical protein
MECYSFCLLAALTALVSNKYDVYAIWIMLISVGSILVARLRAGIARR